jgi:hypothetical protein
MLRRMSEYIKMQDSFSNRLQGTGVNGGEDDDVILGLTPFRLIGRYKCFGETYFIHLQG